MAERIEFVRNYNDLSTDEGFQFEFHCDRCGSGYRTEFQGNAAGKVSNFLDAASSLLGGVFGSAANISNRVQDATYERAHDAAFRKAMDEISHDFVQCPKCLQWVCKEKCWSTKRGLCKECAPDMGVEMSAAQAARSREEVWAHAKMSEEDKKLAESNWRETIVASCPQCSKPLATNAKFCPECGYKLKEKVFCAECGAQVIANAKFCPECGAKRE